MTWDVVIEELRPCLVNLPARPRAALVLRIANQLTYREIGEWLGCSLEHARNLEATALRLLRRAMRRYPPLDQQVCGFWARPFKDRAKKRIGSPFKPTPKSKRKRHPKPQPVMKTPTKHAWDDTQIVGYARLFPYSFWS